MSQAHHAQHAHGDDDSTRTIARASHRRRGRCRPTHGAPRSSRGPFRGPNRIGTRPHRGRTGVDRHIPRAVFLRGLNFQRGACRTNNALGSRGDPEIGCARGAGEARPGRGRNLICISRNASPRNCPRRRRIVLPTRPRSPLRRYVQHARAYQLRCSTGAGASSARRVARRSSPSSPRPPARFRSATASAQRARGVYSTFESTAPSCAPETGELGARGELAS